MSKGTQPECLEVDDTLRHYQRQGKFLLAKVPSPKMKYPFIIAGVYGFPDQPQHTVAMLQATFEAMAEWSHYPCIIAGDLNLVLEEGGIDFYLLNGQWHDAMAAGSWTEAPSPTSFCSTSMPKRMTISWSTR